MPSRVSASGVRTTVARSVSLSCAVTLAGAAGLAAAVVTRVDGWHPPPPARPTAAATQIAGRIRNRTAAIGLEDSSIGMSGLIIIAVPAKPPNILMIQEKRER